MWSTLEQEEAIVDSLSELPRVTVSTVGASVEERPIRLISIGAEADQAALMYVGAQHGNEPAGRQALFSMAEYLATVQDTDVRLRLPGVSGAYCSTPDAAALRITGDIDLRAYVAMDAWFTHTPHGSINYLVSKYTTTGNNRSYALRLGSAGEPQLAWSNNGSNIITRTSTAPVPYALAAMLALRATLETDVDGDNIVRFYVSPGMGGVWSALGEERVNAGTTSIHAGSGVLEIGSHTGGTAGHAPGYVMAAEVRNGVNGTLVAAPDFSQVTPGVTTFHDGMRTWSIWGSAEVVDVGDPDLVAFLDNQRVLIVPTVNPDGLFAGQRRNANDVDINRQHVRLDEPEARTLAVLLGAYRPLVCVDHHEIPGTGSPTDLQLLQTTNAQARSAVVTESLALKSQMENRATAEGWSYSDYSGGTGSAIFRNCLGLRHVVAGLVETSGNLSEADRFLGQWHMADAALRYTVDNLARITDAVLDGMISAESAGEEGTEPFHFDNTGDDVLDPPPLSYRITGVLSELHVDVFNVVVQGNIVSMAQAAQPIIPHLFDELSDNTVSVGERLFVVVPIVAVASVQELAPIVAGSHEPVIVARALSTYQTGYDPTGLDLEIVDGSVTLDGTADVYGTLDITVRGTDPVTGRNMFPRLPTSALSPYGNEVFVARGVYVGNKTLLSPLGYYRIESAEQVGSTTSAIAITGYDRMQAIIDAKPIVVRQLSPNTSVAAVFVDLVGEVYPGATVVFDDDTAAADIGRSLVIEDSRHEVLRELATSFGKVMYWDGQGLLRIESPPALGSPVWRVRAGKGGVVVSPTRRISREGMYNAATAIGEAGDSGREPVRAVVVDRGANSPTRWRGSFGMVPADPFVSPYIKTVGQARQAATAMVRRTLGATYSVESGLAVNPALRPYHVLEMTHDDGTRELHAVDVAGIPLVVSGEMDVSMREQTDVVIGGVPAI